MANIKSAKKRILTNERDRVRNLDVRTRLKGAIKSAKEAIFSDAENKAEIVRSSCRTIDKTVSKGVIHKGAAARKKSRLMALLNKA